MFIFAVVNGYNAVLELPKNNYQWRQKKKGLIKKLRSSMKKFGMYTANLNNGFI